MHVCDQNKATFNFYVNLSHIRRIDYQYLDTSDNQKGLTQLRWRGPVDVNDISINIVGLLRSWGCPQWKNSENPVLSLRE